MTGRWILTGLWMAFAMGLFRLGQIIPPSAGIWPSAGVLAGAAVVIGILLAEEEMRTELRLKRASVNAGES